MKLPANTVKLVFCINEWRFLVGKSFPDRFGGRLGLGSSIDRFKCRFSGVSVAMSNAAKFCLIQLRCRHDCAVDNGAAHLQGAEIALWESSSSEVSRR